MMLRIAVIFYRVTKNKKEAKEERNGEKTYGGRCVRGRSCGKIRESCGGAVLQVKKITAQINNKTEEKK